MPLGRSRKPVRKTGIKGGHVSFWSMLIINIYGARSYVSRPTTQKNTHTLSDGSKKPGTA